MELYDKHFRCMEVNPGVCLYECMQVFMLYGIFCAFACIHACMLLCIFVQKIDVYMYVFLFVYVCIFRFICMHACNLSMRGCPIHKIIIDIFTDFLLVRNRLYVTQKN